MKIELHEPGGAVLALQANSCKWPIGDPPKPGFRFCCAPIVVGEVYCEEHCWKAYPATGQRQPGTRKAAEKARRAG